MKKSFFVTAVVCFFLFTANAQLANTKWKGTLKIPGENGNLQPLPTTWSFQNDTLTIVYAVGGFPADVMTYQEEKNIVSIKKVSGSVPCDNDAVGKFSYEIKGDQLLIRKIEDACTARGASDVSEPFTRIR